MSQLGKSNLNLNLNLNLSSAAGLAANGGAGCRINTQEFRKLVDPAAFPFAPGNAALITSLLGPGSGPRIKYREFWDAELQAYVYLNEFLRRNPDWLTTIKPKLDPIEKELRENIEKEIEAIVDHAPERESRFAEILLQHSAEGCISYWLGMLLIDSSTPATYLLVRVARRIGEHVGMCLKNEFRFPRPSQLCPAIVPMLDPPLHPSFPSGHALQSHLMSSCLKEVRGILPQADTLLDELANRVAVNRVIAGLHYLKDNDAGVLAADELYAMLEAGPMFRALLNKAAEELCEGGKPPKRVTA